MNRLRRSLYSPDGFAAQLALGGCLVMVAGLLSVAAPGVCPLAWIECQTPCEERTPHEQVTAVPQLRTRMGFDRTATRLHATKATGSDQPCPIRSRDLGASCGHRLAQDLLAPLRC